jgi:ubiquinone/menaquinone biosynthesis C-methylase UbiE
MHVDNLLRCLACPACHHALIASNTTSGGVRCTVCEMDYRKTSSGYDFTAARLPVGLESRMPLWNRLQDNGLLSYQFAPELNLATRERSDVAAFRGFMSLDGKVLDVGCGPQGSVPGYIDMTAGIDYVGLDPLQGEPSREFVHIAGMAEMLPFADRVFNRVIFATSLDHLLDMNLALKETARVLSTDGAVYIWTDNLEETQDVSSLTSRALRIAVRGSEQALGGIRRMGVRRTVQYLRQAIKMRVPEGAVDYFHVALPTTGDVTGALAAAGLQVTARQAFKRPLFMKACRN